MGLLRSALLIGIILSTGLAAQAQAQSSPAPFTTAYRYDAMHRVTGVIEADPDAGGVLHYLATRNAYDEAGRLFYVQKGELQAWQDETVAPANWAGFWIMQRFSYNYDALDRKTLEVVNLGANVLTLTNYSYDLAGRLDCTAVRMTQSTFLNGTFSPDPCALTAGTAVPDRITRNIYDAAGQLLQVRRAVGTDREQAYATYRYTPNGHQDVVIDANGNRAEMDYDGQDRQTTWIFPSTTRAAAFNPSTPDSALQTSGAANRPTSTNPGDYEFYTYDPNGNRLTLRKRDGTTIGYQYDALNRVFLKSVPTSATGAAGYGVSQTYDNRGLLLSATFASSGLGITNAYDNAGRLHTSTTNMDGTSRTFASDYDADGNRTQLQGDQGYAAGFEYDGLDRMAVAHEGSVAGNPVAFFLYDQFGLRRWLGQGSGGAYSTTTYAYDPASRLQTLTHDLDGVGTSYDQTLTFGYNPASQIVTRDRTNSAWEYDEQVQGTKSYLTNGLNQYQQAGVNNYQYDANGNLSSDGTRTYVYDAENRLVSVTGDIGATLSYDPMGRLWRYTVSPSNVDLRFLYDGDRLTQELSSTGAVLRSYVFGPGVDEPLVWYENAGGFSRRFLHADHQGSIVAIAGEGGNTLGLGKYDEWGVPWSGNMPGLRFQYTGQAWLPEIGLYYYKARMYSSRLGRFLQTDPVGYQDQVNLYAYVGNDPVDGRDPSGKNQAAKAIIATCEEIAPICGAAVVGTVLIGAATVQTGSTIQTITNWHVNSAGSLPPPRISDRHPGADGKHGSTGGPGAGKRFPPEKPEVRAGKEGVPCGYCGRPTTNQPGRPDSRERDHIDPRGGGRNGNNSPDNERDSCRDCNRSKGNRNPDEWAPR